MYKQYEFSKKDISIITNALDVLWNPKLDYIFKHKERIKDASIISYDSKNIFLWTPIKEKIYKLIKIPHNLKSIDDNLYRGWKSGIHIQEFQRILKDKINKRVFGPCGGPLSPFINIHKKISKTTNDPYFTKESYMATIIHEFGHIYSGRLDKYGELFAFCTEYSASELFWPNHKKNLDKMIQKTLKKDIKSNHHTYSFANVKKVVTQYPSSWPDLLFTPKPRF